MTTLATVNPFARMTVLDVYDTTREIKTRPDALATISAGFKTDKGLPSVSRDGTIHVHDPEGRAPGLKAALMASKGKVLTVTPAFDNPDQFLQQRFVRYSASRLEVYGDQFSLTEIHDTGQRKTVAGKSEPVYAHRSFANGTPEYKTLRETCKVSCSLYFYLAKWEDDGTAKILFPDGFGAYRLRFTSRNSLDNLIENLSLVAQYSGGRVAGVPFDLQIVSREVADPTGARRKVPVWTMTMKHPKAKELDSRIVRKMLETGITEAARLALPAPSAETIDMVEAEIIEPDMDAVELDADDIRQLTNGQSPRFRIKQWHAAVRDTVLDSDDARHEFIGSRHNGFHLSDAAKYLDQAEWDELLAAANAYISNHAAEQQQENHDARMATAPAAQGVTDDMVGHLRQICKASKLPAASVFEFLAFVAGRDEAYSKLEDITLEDVEKILARCGDDDPSGGWMLDDELALPALLKDYDVWLASDAAAGEVLK